MLLIASSPDYRGRRPTVEIMAVIVHFGVASWLQPGTTDVAMLIAAMSGRGGGRSDSRFSGAGGNTDGSPRQEAKISKCHFLVCLSLFLITTTFNTV